MDTLIEFLLRSGVFQPEVDWLHAYPTAQAAWDACTDPYWMRQYLHLVLPPGTPDPTDEAARAYSAAASASAIACFDKRHAVIATFERSSGSDEEWQAANAAIIAAYGEYSAAGAALLLEYANNIRAAVPVCPLPG